MKKLLALLVVLVSGCVSLSGEELLNDEIGLYVAPVEILEGREADANLGFQNIHNSTIKNIRMEIFGPLLNEETCVKSLDEIKKNSIELLECKLKAPEKIINDETFEINSKVSYEKEMNLSFTLSIISDEDYELEVLKDTLSREKKTFSGGDGNIDYTLEYIDEYPVRYNDDEKIVFHIDFSNVGEGIVKDVQNPVRLTRLREELDISGFCEPIRPIGKNFPRITCDIESEGEINYLNEDTLIITITYIYEIDATTSIRVVK